MAKKMVAIVGRPNVGKSTLFNTLAGERLAIVKDVPGVTRDRIYADVEWLNHKFTIVDTGGIDTEAEDIIMRSMREQAEIAIETSDVILFVTDVKAGVTASDIQVADMIRKSGKPVVLVVNKVDNYEKYESFVYEFYNLGIGDPYPVSAAVLRRNPLERQCQHRFRDLRGAGGRRGSPRGRALGTRTPAG